jgi:hypothetical protein
VLWIKGDPGKGKTMLLCGIIDDMSALTRLEDKSATTLLSFFFCQATDSRINNAAAVLRGLIYLLIDQQPSLLSHVRKKYDHASKALFEDANAWVALSEIFTSILQDPGLNSTYLIIDALGECVADLPKLLEFVVQKSVISPRIKWVISSRNWRDIEERLERARQKIGLCLELNPSLFLRLLVPISSTRHVSWQIKRTTTPELLHSTYNTYNTYNTASRVFKIGVQSVPCCFWSKALRPLKHPTHRPLAYISCDKNPRSYATASSLKRE